ncbi:MAG: hypothetical protein Q4B47_01115 [Eubacteriales bacterium]|nr:hypothetical protein [Eubacteriales bacterium]
MRDIDITDLQVFLKEHQEDKLEFSSCNRIVLPDPNMTVEQFLASLKLPFEVIAMPAGFVCQPMEKHSFSMYIDGQWFLLKTWPELYQNKTADQQVDAVIFNRQILKNIFKIENIVEDERLLLMDNSFRIDELTKIADRMKGVLFLLHPISREEIELCLKNEIELPPMSFCVEVLA